MEIKKSEQVAISIWNEMPSLKTSKHKKTLNITATEHFMHMNIAIDLANYSSWY